MLFLPPAQSRLACGVVLGLLCLSASPLSAREQPRAKEQLEILQAALRSLEPESSELKTKPALTFAPRPLLRYSDPTRGGVNDAANVLLDAGLWRLGTDGRPTALVAVELYQAPNRSHILAFEFLSLTEAKFALKHKTERIRWDATGSALNLKDMPGAPKPAATAAARLAQMRRMARRFAAKERLKDESIECRLLTQPIDRYESAADRIVDGAIFVYANGTNPEVGVAFECDGECWQYGILRFTSAEASVTLDGKSVASFEPFDAHGRNEGPYHNAAHKVQRVRESDDKRED